MADKCKLLFVNENMLFCPARWKLHYRSFKFENFLGEQAPRPPSPLKKRLVLIQSVTLIKSTGYFNNIVIEIPGEMIILFFPKIWLIFKVRFAIEKIIVHPFTDLCQRWKLSNTSSLRVKFYTQFPKIACTFLSIFSHACFAHEFLV